MDLLFEMQLRYVKCGRLNKKVRGGGKPSVKGSPTKHISHTRVWRP